MADIALPTDRLSARTAWIKHTRDLYNLPVMLSADDLKTLGIDWTDAHLLQLERAAKFPHRVVLGGRTTRWSCEELLHWLFDRVLAREAEQAKRCEAIRREALKADA